MRSSSGASESAQALEKLERILMGYVDPDGGLPAEDNKSPYLPGRKASKRMLRKHSTIGSSDTEHRDDFEFVPSADVILDNSRTLGYSGGAAASTTSLQDSSRRAKKDREAWLQFKSEIVRLAYTLRLKGWRRVPLDYGEQIEVVRLSGALTNAVYVVSPPSDLPVAPPDPRSSTASIASKRVPV